MSVQRPAVFIGSSSEGKPWAEHLQAALEEHCESTVWDQGVFGLSASGLFALVKETRRVDFAILVLTPDDLTHVRGVDAASARDNVIFEAGLFIGAIGPERTFLVHANDVRLDLPTDLAGITTCTFVSKRRDKNLRAAVNTAALRIRDTMLEVAHGASDHRPPPDSTRPRKPSAAPERARLEQELDALTASAERQRWSLKTRNESVYRLVSPAGDLLSLSLGAAPETRGRLRDFARDLANRGLRVPSDLLVDVDDETG
jgi:hypothetical protein